MIPNEFTRKESLRTRDMAKFRGLVDTPTKNLAKSTFAFKSEDKVPKVDSLEDHSNSQIKQKKPLEK